MFVTAIGIYKPQDIRPILEAYSGKDIPIEYAKKEAEAQEKHVEEWKQIRGGLSSGGFTLTSLFGGGEVGRDPLFHLFFNTSSLIYVILLQTTHSPVPPTYLEQKRAEAQQTYRQELAYIETNKATLDKMIEEQRQHEAKEMSGSLWNIMTGKKAEGDKTSQAKGGEAPAQS